MRYAANYVQDFRDKLFASTTPEPNTGCLLWVRSYHRQGYGHFAYRGTVQLAHRVAWQAAYGHLAANICVRHRCDTPACVNVEHLFLGTKADNNHDCAVKGRAWNPTAKRKRSQTQCKHGHQFTAENTYLRPNGTRACVSCRHIRTGRWNSDQSSRSPEPWNAMPFETLVPRARAWEFEWSLTRKDPDSGVPSPIPETSAVSAWFSLTDNGEPITPGSVVVLTRRALELRTDARRLWFGILDRDAVTEALDDLLAGATVHEVCEVDGERDSREHTVED